MGTSYLPVNQNWGRYIHQSNTAFQDMQRESKQLLIRLANDACEYVHDDEWVTFCFEKIYEPHCDKTIKMACAPSEDSDQPGHPPSLIRAFAVRLKKARFLSYPLSAQRRLIRLVGCPGWSESSLGAHAILLVLSWGGSYMPSKSKKFGHSEHFCNYPKIWAVWFLPYSNVSKRCSQPVEQCRP